MMRFLGRAGSRTKRRSLLVAILSAGVLFLFVTPGAQAVHNSGAFELEGNATTDHGAGLPDDWDRVCHQVTGSDCSTSSDTTGATAVSWTAELNRNATIFTGGGSKDPQDIVPNWKWKDGAGGLPDKDNLQHSFAARYSMTPSTNCPSPNATCELLFFGSDRLDNSGDAQQGFWFLQNRVGLDSSTHTFTLPHQVGDLLILSDFSNGGGTSTINVFEWVGSGGNTNGTLQSLTGGVSAKCGGSGVDDFCGIVNPTNGTVAPWSFLDKSGNTTYLNGEFYEGGINLSTLPGGIASECFASFLSETRSSTSPTATLKDFVLGNFGVCQATMSTQVSSAAVAPGQPVHDTATVVGNQPTKTPSGDVTFFLCGPISTGACDGTINVGSSIGTGTLSGSGATSSADSPDVNTGANPLGPGRYCFRAQWPGDNNYGPLTEYGGADGTNECFTVAKIPTNTVTTPVDGSGTPTSSIILGSSIYDKAVVTGDAVGGDPTGDVTFFICGPISTGTCDGTINVGTQVGSPVGLTSDGDPSTYTSSATSAAATPGSVGRYCFRGEYGGSSVYLPSSDGSEDECFTVTDTSTASSAQNWLPNDSGTVSSDHGAPVKGTLSFTLYHSSDCTGDVLYGPVTFTLSGANSSETRNTTNSTVKVSITDTVSWNVVFTPDSGSNVSGSSHCETTSLTITN